MPNTVDLGRLLSVGMPHDRLPGRSRECYLRGDLPGLRSSIAAMERAPNENRTLLLTAHFNAGLLASKQGKAEIAVEHSLKLLKLLRPDPHQGDCVRATGLLVKAALGLLQLERTERAPAQNRIEAFMHEMEFSPLPAGEKRSWLVLLETVFPLKHLDLKERLCEELFQATADPVEKGHLVMTWLLNARRQVFVKPGSVTPETARAKAEYLLRQVPSVITDRSGSDDEVFHTLIVNLTEFGLADLVDEALKLRAPDPADPIITYLRLSRLLATDPARAFAEVMKLTPAKKPAGDWSPTIDNELRVLCVKITRHCLETNRVPVSEAQLPPHCDDLLTAEYCTAPRGGRAELVAEIRAVRARMLAGLADVVRGGGYYLESQPFDRFSAPGDGCGETKSFMIIEPHAGAAELYFPAQTGEDYVKVRFPFTRDQTGKPTGLNPQAYFDGVADKDQLAVPFIWDYIALNAFTRKSGAELLPCLQNKLMAAIKDQSKANAEAFYARIAEALMARPEFQQGQIDLENRLNIALRIIGQFALEPRSGNYQLTGEDPLNLFFREVEVIARPRHLAVTLAGAGKDEHILLEYNDWRKTLLPDLPGEALADRYVRELILTALIKLCCCGASKRADTRRGTGYLVDGSEELASRSANLKSIYRLKFYEQLRRRGLNSVTWYCREPVEKTGEESSYYEVDDFLYRPLPDQSADAKTEAVSKYKTENLFVAVQPTGGIQRLPVRKVNQDGKIILGPYKRNPNRLIQQEIMGESQALPEYHGLFVLTIFDAGSPHLRLVALRENGNDVIKDGLIERTLAEIDRGLYRDPEVLLKDTKGQTRSRISSGLVDNTLHILAQTAELFNPVMTTYRRPCMESLAALLAKSFVLE